MWVNRMPTRLFLFLSVLFIGLAGCGRYSGFDDSEFGQNFSDAFDPLNSMYAQSLSVEGQQFISLMDRVSEEYAECWAYFLVESVYLESPDTSKAQVAQDLAIMASRVGRGSDMASRVAFRRQSHYVRAISGYYEDNDKDWETIRGEYDSRCNSATRDVHGAIARLMKQD